MKSAAKLIRRFVSILLLSAVLLVIINVAVYAVLVSEKAPTQTTSPYDIAEKAGEALQVLPREYTVLWPECQPKSMRKIRSPAEAAAAGEGEIISSITAFTG